VTARGVSALVLAALLAHAAPAAAQTDLFVQSEHADMFSQPSSRGPRVNRVYARQMITAYETRDGWARVTPPGTSPRWMEIRLLGPNRPAERPPVQSAAIFSDSRIVSGSLAVRPGDGLDVQDVEMLWRAARRALDTGCRKIVGGDKSVSRPNTFYISCDGEPRNRFYTAAELSKR
jgi:hypothetical protein